MKKLACFPGWQFIMPFEMGLIKDFHVDNKTNLPYGCGIDLKVPVEDWNIGNHRMDSCPVTYAPEGETLPDIVELFAENHDIWQDTFFEAWEKLQVNGYSKTDLTEAPSNAQLLAEQIV